MTAITRIAMILAITLGVGLFSYGFHVAYHMGEANAQAVVVDAGVGSGDGSAATAPTAPSTSHVDVPDPTEDLGGFMHVVQDATGKKKGWLGVVLVCVYALTRLLGKAKKWWSRLEYFDHGYPAMIIATAATMLTAAIDTFFLGASLGTIVAAAIYALIGSLGVAKKAA